MQWVWITLIALLRCTMTHSHVTWLTISFTPLSPTPWITLIALLQCTMTYSQVTWLTNWFDSTFADSMIHTHCIVIHTHRITWWECSESGCMWISDSNYFRRDLVTIVNDTERAKVFRCVEYSNIFHTVLQSVFFKISQYCYCIFHKRPIKETIFCKRDI